MHHADRPKHAAKLSDTHRSRHPSGRSPSPANPTATAPPSDPSKRQYHDPAGKQPPASPAEQPTSRVIEAHRNPTERGTHATGICVAGGGNTPLPKDETNGGTLESLTLDSVLSVRQIIEEARRRCIDAVTRAQCDGPSEHNGAESPRGPQEFIGSPAADLNQAETEPSGGWTSTSMGGWLPEAEISLLRHELEEALQNLKREQAHTQQLNVEIASLKAENFALQNVQYEQARVIALLRSHVDRTSSTNHESPWPRSRSNPAAKVAARGAARHPPVSTTRLTAPSDPKSPRRRTTLRQDNNHSGTATVGKKRNPQNALHLHDLIQRREAVGNTAASNLYASTADPSNNAWNPTQNLEPRTAGEVLMLLQARDRNAIETYHERMQRFEAQSGNG